MKQLMLLTRQGCVITPQIVNNLEEALRVLGWSRRYQCVDIGELPLDRPEAGYATPTLLYNGRDMFGMTAPQVPRDAPT